MSRLSELFFTAIIGLVPVVAFCQAQAIETIQVQEDLYFVGDRTYSCFYLTNEGVVVIDPLDSTHAAATMAAIRKVTMKPVTYVFYSHNHWDHISGGQVFKEEGTKFVSHTEAKNQLTPHPQVIIPDSTWSGNKAIFTYGGKTMELYFYGRNHGDGMTVFRFPEYKAVFIIDLVVPDRVLYTYLPDASPKNWLEDLEKIQQLEFKTVYMAHNRVVGDRTDITLMQNYFRDLYGAVEEAMESEVPFFDIPQTVKLPQYSHLQKYDEWLHMNVWRIMMEKTTGK